jgi:aspartate racemase
MQAQILQFVQTIRAIFRTSISSTNHRSPKAGLLGTHFTMTGPAYPEVFLRHHIGVLPPPPEHQKLIGDIIFNELVHGVFPENSRLHYNNVTEMLKREGCDCVILGCTEIPLLVREDDCPLPTLDSTRLLARAAVQHALAVDSAAQTVQESELTAKDAKVHKRIIL